MGCMCAKATPATKPYVVPVALRLKCATYNEEIREAYSIKRSITSNSTTGLFLGEEVNTPKGHIYVRYARLNKSQLDALTRRFDCICTKKADFPQLLPYDAAGQTQFFLYLVMKTPQHTRSLLSQIISGKLALNESSLCATFSPIFATLSKMHLAGVPHGQINPDKFLVINGSCYLFDICVGNESVSDRLSENFRFLSPEELNGEGPSSEGDVWALGATLYYLVTGRAVYPGASHADFRAYAASRDPAFDQPIWSILSPELKKLLQGMLARSKHDRLTMSQVCNSVWVRGGATERDVPIDNAATLVTDTKRRICMQKAKYAVANERPPRAMNEITNKLRTIDYNGRNNRYLEFGEIMEAATAGSPIKCEDCDFFWTESIYYESFMSDVTFLNALLNHERLSILFYQISHNKEYVTDLDIRKVFECGVTHREYTAPAILEELIRSHQKGIRMAPILYYVEFVEMCQYINFAPVEGLIMGKFFASDELADSVPKDHKGAAK